MEIRTVDDLKNYLSSKKVSPESFGRDIKVSNMTIRRLLRKKGGTPIPEKYQSLFELHIRDDLQRADGILANLSDTKPGGFSSLLNELEATGSKISDFNKLDADVKTKLFDKRIDKALRAHVAQLVKSIRSKKYSMRQKAICVGALLYLINPLDLIPDTIPVIGYLDDFAVLSLAVGVLVQRDKTEVEQELNPRA